MVDLPEAERPVNHSVKPFWPRRALRSGWVTDEGCHVMLLAHQIRDDGRRSNLRRVGAPTWPFYESVV